MRATWTYPDRLTGSDADVTGIDVEGTDGSIGKIDESSALGGRAYIVVDKARFFIFDKKRMMPAGIVNRIATSLCSMLRVIRCLSRRVCSAAGTALGPTITHSAGRDPFGNTWASNGHQFWGDEE